MSFYKSKIVLVVFFGFVFFLIFVSQASAQQCIWRDTFGCAGFGEYIQYSPNTELCEGDPPNNTSTCCCRPSTPPPSGYQWTTGLSCGSLGYEWFQYYGDPNNCGVKPQGGTYCCVYQSNFINIGGCCQRVCEPGSFNCADGCFQGSCPNSIPGVVRYVFTKSSECKGNVCDYIPASSGTVDTVQNEPIEFKPQVTIPGEIKVGDKVFTLNKGVGIVVDGELLSKYIALLFNWLIGAIGVIAVAYMGFGGMQWLAAAGSAESINKAKGTIKDAMIGLVLVAGSYTMLFIINPRLVGFDGLKIANIEGKPLQESSEAVLTGQTKGMECFYREFGSSASEVESQLVNVNILGKRLRVHRKAQSAFNSVIAAIPSNITYKITDNASGTFNWRSNVNNPSSQSLHSFGIAIDINPNKNPNEKRIAGKDCETDIPNEVVNAFRNNGFRWGGDYRTRCDTMHFEWLGPCAK